MYSKTIGCESPSSNRPSASRLTVLLPDAQVNQQHSGIVDAPPGEVWVALRDLKWSELVWSRPLLAMRGLLSPATSGHTVVDTFTRQLGGALLEHPPHRLVVAMVGKPWSLTAPHVRIATVDEIGEFTEPGWLTYGMECPIRKCSLSMQMLMLQRAHLHEK